MSCAVGGGTEAPRQSSVPSAPVLGLQALLAVPWLMLRDA